MVLDIGEVIARTGLPASTLRYYEERALIEPVGRRRGRRQYDDAVIQRLALITLGQAAGFSLDEIASVFDTDGTPRIDRAALRAKADELDVTIDRLTSMRDGLRHAADCPAPTHVECPTFRALLDAATAGEYERPGRR